VQRLFAACTSKSAPLLSLFPPNSQLIAPTVALGFEGGHGTAAGVKGTFVQLGYPEGANLTLCAATIGLLSGVLFGKSSGLHPHSKCHHGRELARSKGRRRWFSDISYHV